MKEPDFSLQPFYTENTLHDFRITGRIGRNLNKLTILYELSGPLKDLIIPPLSDEPARMERLWEETCFEFFLKEKDSDIYWEFNLSPSGDWNIYRFKTYRQGMHEEQAFNSLAFSVQTYSDILRLELEFDLEKIIPQDQAINVAVCVVTKAVNSAMGYWALVHTGLKPDFHRQDSFTIEVSNVRSGSC